MLIEGAWWEEEASDVFRAMSESMADGEKYSRKNRRFGFMPMPHYDDAYYNGSKIGQKNTLVSSNYALVIINKKIQPFKLDLAKKFLRFTSTDAMLQRFTETISVTRPFNYELPEDKLSAMSTFGQSLYNIRKSSDVLYPFSGNRFWLSTKLDFESLSFSNAVVNGKTHTYVRYA